MKSIAASKRALQLFVSFSVTAFLFAGLIAPTVAFAEQSTSTQSSQKDQKTTKKEDKKKAKKVTSKTVTETRSIAFKTLKQNDPNTAAGQTTILQNGVNGSKKVTYKVTYPKDKKAKKTFVSEKVITAPINKIVGVGTYVAPPPAPAPAAASTSSGNSYTNVDGNQIESPSNNTTGATGVCRDGTYTHAVNHRGACSSHGGVDHWL
ncbi:MAG: hypothetical protein JWO35_179 [Candidatus Saccharibacteria bacterium]|nr:hypothetical protein [Candidatus Saccharibacteria bacterium]